MTISRHSLADVAVRTPRAVWNAARARVSVVIISRGTAAGLAQPLASFVSRCRDIDAELIVVRAANELSSASPALHGVGARIVSAPADCTTADLREIGMREATGDIVTVRTEEDLSDTRWLHAFDRYSDTAGAVPPTLGVSAAATFSSPVRDSRSAPRAADT